MIGPGSNAFQNAEKQQNDTVSQGWQKFADTNNKINAENVAADKKKRIKHDKEKKVDFAEEAHKGHDTGASMTEDIDKAA